MDLRDEINKRKKENWIEAWFIIEVMAISKEAAESSLEKHIQNLSKVQDAFVYETKFHDTKETPAPPSFKIETLWSQIVEIKLFVKSLDSLLNIIYIYGPSSIEILGPGNLQINLAEVQNIANTLAGLIHQFAAAGLGGMVISPK